MRTVAMMKTATTVKRRETKIQAMHQGLKATLMKTREKEANTKARKKKESLAA